MMNAARLCVCFIVTTLAVAGSAVHEQARAVSGCCLQRATTNDLWYNNGRSFEDCAKLNAQLDNDNVVDEAGLVWWNLNC